MKPLTDIMNERGSVYGPFHRNASVAQSLKEVMHRAPNWDKLPNYMKESLDLICTKISRILTGESDHVDNWDDIGGYARLPSRYLNEEIARNTPQGKEKDA